MPESAIVITTTSDQLLVLEKIAQLLVEQKLAACVQVGLPVTSFFFWGRQIGPNRRIPVPNQNGRIEFR